MVDRGPVGAGADEDLVQFVRRDLDVLTEDQWQLVIKAVDHKIKQVLLVEFVVCLGLLHTSSKQTLTLTRCDRLILGG